MTRAFLEISRLTSSDQRWGRSLKAWITLFRPPNLLSVPGDPLAGSLLAASATGVMPSGANLFSIIGAALLLYAAGLLANDYFDRHVDARERPRRPIPSGAVAPLPVLLMALALTLLAIGLATRIGLLPLLATLATATALWIYNGTAKHHPLLGPLLMGLCRGGSLAMGAALTGIAGFRSPGVILSLAMLVLLIGLITRLARDEADHTPRVPPLVRWSIPVCVVSWILLACVISTVAATPSSLILGGMAALWSAVLALQLKPDSHPNRIPATVGALIRGLILIQAALCALGGPGGTSIALLLLLLFPLSGWLSRWYYGS